MKHIWKRTTTKKGIYWLEKKERKKKNLLARMGSNLVTLGYDKVPRSYKGSCPDLSCVRFL